jgi:ADP-ribose pyrophosphatase YjhB (NUDIX family)
VHYLQKAILDKLRYEQPLTYTALMPDAIESSHFRYHLKLLMTDGLIVKYDDSTYILSDKGAQEVDYLSANRTTITRTPKIITYTLLSYDDTLLLYTKPKEPYRGLVGLIGGKVHYGEPMDVSATREIVEKTGITLAREEAPTLAGVADIIIDKNGQPQSHVVAYVHTVRLINIPDKMPIEFVQITKEELPKLNLLPDVLPLLAAINKATTPFVTHVHCELVTSPSSSEPYDSTLS